MSTELKTLVAEFISLLEIEEVSDGGHTFHPNRITSCRTMDLDQLGKLLSRMKELTDE